MMEAIAEKVLATEANTMKVFGTVRSRGRSAKKIKSAVTEQSDDEPPTRSRMTNVRTWSSVNEAAMFEGGESKANFLEKWKRMGVYLSGSYSPEVAIFRYFPSLERALRRWRAGGSSRECKMMGSIIDAITGRASTTISEDACRANVVGLENQA